MKLLDKQLSQLNGEIKEITSNLKQLYSRLDSEQDLSSREKLEERIKELKREKSELNGRREKLENKLQPRGFEGDEKRKLDEVHRYIQEQKQAKSVLYLSTFKTVDMQRVAERAGLKFEEATLPERRAKGGIQEFGWDDCLEKAQHDCYMPHLRAIIQPKAGDLTWVNAALTEPSMLSYNSETMLDIKVRGTTDVAICTRTSVLGHSPQLGLKVLFELKKSAGKEATTHARIKLLLANLHSPKQRPIVVLTDLNDCWIVFWLSKDTIYQFPFETRGHAVAFIEDFLGDIVTPDVTRGHADITARAAISKALLSSESLDPVLKEQIESLEGVASRGDVDQLKVQGLMSLLHAVPTFPSWESKPPPFGIHT